MDIAEFLRRKKGLKGGLQFSLRIGFSIWRKEEIRVISLTREAFYYIRTIMEQKMPVSLIRQPKLGSPLNQLLEVWRGRVNIRLRLRWVVKTDAQPQKQANQKTMYSRGKSV
jgi:hypothetical protein